MYNTVEEASRAYEIKKIEFEADEASKNGSNNVKNTTDKTLSSAAVSQPPKPAVLEESMGVIFQNSPLSVLDPETFSIFKKINDSTTASQTSNVETKIEDPCVVMSSVVEEALSLAKIGEDEESCELPYWELKSEDVAWMNTLRVDEQQPLTITCL
ncbi:hypothetical protein L6452_02915 [Arctium lappa]|uniref:Uncharacterized protein n=1 Tax=Arctium lappa TaxID=4217 RepID=A0ACB9FLC9_ARCLA|nr:hypothetical protein L6452_02915 [Arctium lappa]